MFVFFLTKSTTNPSGLLLRVDLPGGRRIEYAYDSSGLRTKKCVDGRVVEAYRWLDPLRLSEFHDGREWWRLAYASERPGRGGRTPVGVTNGRDSFLIYSDHLGTPLALADMDGNVVQVMRYDAFGNLLQVRGDVVRLPVGFAGGLFDADTGLTRFVWRDYDADTGRFTALDPMGAKGGSARPHSYAGPIIATTVARNPEKVEQAYDFLSGALDPSLPPTTSAGVWGSSAKAGLDNLERWMRDNR